ncbi:MAG: hypothetical protein JXA03_10185 [Bacteroidales bacterium]|nr:hypothetical protein [Bacteroidales bacterium]
MATCNDIGAHNKKREISLSLPVVLLLLIIFTVPDQALSQYWGNTPKNKLLRDYSINVNFGITSFFGDLSIYDSDFASKLAKESGPGYGLVVVKHFMKHKIGVGGQLLFGQFQGENSNSSFEASIVEYNFHGRADIRNIFWPVKKRGWSVPDCSAKPGAVVYAGIGQFLFDSKRTFKDPTEPELPREKTGVPEFVYFFGGQAYVEIACTYRFTLDLALRQAQQDKLDVKWDAINFDYYSYLSIGITYKIKSLAFNKQGSWKKKGRFPTKRKGSFP